ncbi:MAG: glycosyltransferase family 39 protein [Lachnospiraceae bacterium]|nr:glycosyltransferase family 39 protein [Lachnospiraceae bacterium]
MHIIEKIENKLKSSDSCFIVHIIGAVFIIAGIAVAIYMQMVNRSLNLDESSLAYTVYKRNLFNLCASLPDRNQSAPVGYLYFVKFLTIPFGIGERVLRFPSFLSYILTIILTYFYGKRAVSLKYPLIASALTAVNIVVLKYSNSFKPYEMDCVCVLLVLIFAWIYEEKKISFIHRTVFYCVIIWFSNPSAFFIGGVLAYEFIYIMIKKEYFKLKGLFITGAGIAISFSAYYLFWLRITANGDHMQNYWEGRNWPFIPMGLSDVKKMHDLIWVLMQDMGSSWKICIILTFLSLAVCIIDRNKWIIRIYLSYAIAMFASWLNMFPVSSRLWLFHFPMMALLICYTIEKVFLLSKIQWIRTAGVLLFTVLLIFDSGVGKYSVRENIFDARQQPEGEYRYILSHIKENDRVYVFDYAAGTFEYLNGYGNNSIGGYEDNLLFWNNYTYEDGMGREDFDQLSETGNAYIAISHASKKNIAPLLYFAENSGNLDLVSYEHETPLYYYYKEPVETKKHVSYSVKDKKTYDGCSVYSICMENGGDSYLNHEYENVYLGCKENPGIMVPINKIISPGESFEVEITIPDTVSNGLTLSLFDGKWYDDYYGIDGLRISKAE